MLHSFLDSILAGLCINVDNLIPADSSIVTDLLYLSASTYRSYFHNTMTNIITHDKPT